MRGGTSIRIAIYVAISSERERQARAAIRSWRTSVKRALNVVSAYAFSRPRIDFYAWEAVYSNKGDILIREAVKQQLVETFAPRPVEFLEISWGELTDASAQTINATCELFVIGGSGYLFPNNGRFPQRFFCDSSVIPQIQQPKIAMGIGFNTILGDTETLESRSQSALQELVRSLDFVSVRDRRTETLVAPYAQKAVILTGDPVLLYKDRPGPASGLARTKRLQLGLNLAMHGPVSAANIQRDIDKIAALLRRISEAIPVDWHYIAHAPSERMVWWLLRARGLHPTWHDPAPEFLAQIYRTLDAHLCQMMHSAIVAMSVNVPVTAFAYDEKTVGLFELMDLSKYCVPIDGWTVDDICQTVLSMTESHAKLAASIKVSRAKLAETSHAFLGDVRSLV